MRKFRRYKVNASQLPALLGRDSDNLPPTEKEAEEFFKIMEKDEQDITIRQESLVLKFVSRVAKYDETSISGGMKSELYKHYAYARFGVSKVSLSGEKPLQLDKGEVAEPDAIQLLNQLDGTNYVKNEKLYHNEWFKGIPDIVLSENEKIIGVKDVKVSLDLPSFLARVDGDCLRDDAWEMRAYLDILGLKEGEICYCLVNMPEQYRKKRLEEHKSRLTLAGYTTEHIKQRLKQIEKSMMYDYIAADKKVKRFVVQRKGFFTKQARNKVAAVRTRMLKLHEKFENLVPLSEITQSTPEDLY